MPRRGLTGALAVVSSLRSRAERAVPVCRIDSGGAQRRLCHRREPSGPGLQEPRVGLVHGFSAGVSYDTSPVDDDDRTFDLPVDEQLKFSFAYGRKGKGKFDYAVGATALYGGDAKIDQTAQGARTRGEFDTNWIFFIGGTLRYVF